MLDENIRKEVERNIIKVHGSQRAATGVSQVRSGEEEAVRLMRETRHASAMSERDVERSSVATSTSDLNA